MTTARLRRGTIPLALGAAAFALALLQHPGWSSSDTKIDLHTDPGRFLHEIASLWTPSSGLGGVESAQYAGYLFPMGPFFALGHVLGVPDWVVDRVWLGLLLAVACWGVVRLVDAIGAARSPAGRLTAGLIYLFNPYVVVFANRTTITLLAYALLPWLVLASWRGLREPRRWRWPALFALLATASGGGVNAAVAAFVLLAPLVLVFYEPLTGAVQWRAARIFGVRALGATVIASLWWIAPAAAQTKYGVDFLRFTEPAGAIWATTSLSESFRAMGYWISYIGVGFNGAVRPYFSDSGTLLFNAAVLWATFLIPGVALASFTWTRTRRYAAFFLLLVLLGTLVMFVGFPTGTPLRRGATFAYNHIASTRFLRTTYKAGPLVVLGVAGLAAMAIELALARRRLLAPALALAGCAAVALSAWPLVRGRAVDRQTSWKHIPPAWRAVARDLDQSLGNDRRAVVLPGQLYAFYDWGGTVDPILPALTKKPVAVRNAVPYGDLRGTDLLWATDALVQQRRLLPGQLRSLLGLISAGRVVSATDDDVFRSGGAEPAAAAGEIDGQGLGAAKAYGPLRSFPAPRGDVAGGARLPEVRMFGVGGARSLVRLEGRAPMTIVDGSADALADLAAFRDLPPRRALAYAGDLKPAAIAAAARAGGDVVISDSNRRRVQVVSRMQQNTGATLGPDDPISEDAATLDPFPARGTAAQTVALLHGARWIRAPFSPGYSQLPEHRPFAAFDGDPRTAWIVDRALTPDRHWVEIGFLHPRDVPYVDILGRAEAGAAPVAVSISGHRYALKRGWTHIPLGIRNAASLRILVHTRGHGSAAAAGLAEVRVPGLHITESLRPPTLAEDGLRGTDLSHAGLTYTFSRASGDDPWAHTTSAGVRIRERVTLPSQLEQLLVDGRGDEETGIDRVIAPPVVRTYGVRAWISVLPEARDSALDRLAGYRGATVADSSARYQGTPGRRASSAFDGSVSTSWIAPWDPLAPPWLRISRPRPMTIRSLSFAPAPPPVRAPLIVEVASDGGVRQRVRVVGNRILLRPVRTRTLTLTILRARGGGVPAVGIAELRISGVPRMHVRRAGSLAAGCGVVTGTTAGGPLRLRVRAGIRALDAGAPMRAEGCGTVRLPAGEQRIRLPASTLRVDKLLLTSAAPAPLAQAAVQPGSVDDSGKPGRGSRTGVRLSVERPAWLVLGESYDRGWRATCDGHSLGAPVPLDGYANAWQVGPGCHKASFTFAPQGTVRLVQILSGLACLVLLAIALRRPKRVRIRPRSDTFPIRDKPAPLGGRRAIVAGLVAGAVLAFCFSVRSGLVIAPGIALILWRGVTARVLAFAGGALLALVVPIVYLAFPSKDMGGYNPSYAGDHVGGHWVAVAAWILLALALWRTLSKARAGAEPETGSEP